MRHIDYTGVSGVGVVAYGVVFFDGHVALRWCSNHPATSLWDSIDDLLAVHGHGDGTSVQWIDDLADRLQDAAEQPRSSRGRRARRAGREDESARSDLPPGTELAGAGPEPDSPPSPPPPPPPADTRTPDTPPHTSVPATPPAEDRATGEFAAGQDESEPAERSVTPPPGRLAPWSGERANGRHFSAGADVTASESQAAQEENIVPPQRRSGGRHRKSPEPSEESAGYR